MTTSGNEYKQKRRLWPWLLIPVVLLLVLAGVRMSLKSDWLLERVKTEVEKQANRQLEGNLTIGSLRGDLLYGIQLDDLLITDLEGSEIVSADSIHASYLWFRLIRQPFELESLSLHGVRVMAQQMEDERWNLEKLLPQTEMDESTGSAGVSWSIREISMSGNRIDIRAPFLPDEQVGIRQLELHANQVGMEGEEWFGELSTLRFLLEEQRFTGPVEFGLAGDIQGREISLQQLVIHTGRSILEANLELTDFTSFDGQVSLTPLSWQDLLAYADVPLAEDLDIRAGFRGGASGAGIELTATAADLERFYSRAEFQFEDEISLTGFELSLEQFHGIALTGDTLMPDIGRLSLSGEGEIPLSNPESGFFSLQLESADLSWMNRPLQRLEADLIWNGEDAELTLSAEQNTQRIWALVSAGDLFGDRPHWVADIQTDQLNLAVWLRDETFESDLNFSASLNGRGIEISEEEFTLDLQIRESRWGNEHLSAANLRGSLSASVIQGLFDARRGSGHVEGEFEVREWQSEFPLFDIHAQLFGINLAEFTGFEEFPTEIEATLSGGGSGFDPGTMEAFLSVSLDSSIVNGERIDRLRLDANLQDRILTVHEAELQSPIADGTFSARQHIFDLEEMDNRFDMDLRIRDLSSLSPLFGVDHIQAAGRIGGTISRQEEGLMKLDVSFGFEELVYDTLFTAAGFDGVLEGVLRDIPELQLTFDIDRPSITGIQLQSIHSELTLFLQEEGMAGDLRLDMVESDEYALRHQGTFQYTPEAIELNTTRLDLETPLRWLSLADPFYLTYRDEVLRMETLRIESDDREAWLQLSIPYLSEEQQHLVLDAQSLDLGGIQRSLLDESYLDAHLSGRFRFEHANGEIDADGGLFFHDIRVHDGRMDSLSLNLAIQNRRLSVNSGAWNQAEEVYRFHAEVPFEPADPRTLDVSFFEQPVEGSFRLHPSRIRFWSDFLAPEYRADADGWVRFSGDVSGSAGDPRFQGEFRMSDGILSGVAVDSLLVNILYSHESEQVHLDGFLESIGTRIATFQAELPFYLDLRRFEIDLPEESDPIYMQMNTDSFNLVLLNDFLDRDLMRDLRGTLNGQVELRGTVGSPEPSGMLTVRNGNLRVVPAGIVLSDIRSDIQFRQNEVQVESFSMRSGPGQFTASGTMAITDLQPGAMAIRMQANQFRAANTNDLNMILDLTGTLTGTLESPRLGGTLRFRSGYINLQNFGDRAIEQIELEDEEPDLNIAFYENMAIDMRVEFDRQFFLRNRQYLDMEVELAGILELQKQPGEELQLFGSVEGVEGFARPLGRYFELEDAVVTFYGPIENPELNIRTLYRPPQPKSDIRIWYVIEGTVEDPGFRFESEPFLELQDIISYTIFGQPFYALDSWKQVVATGSSNTTAADVALELLMDRVEMLATQQLGIDVVQIDNNRSGSGSTTSIKTGWFLNNRTFFAISNEISTNPKTLFILEYMLRDNLELIITQGDDSREGVDLRWSFDY